MLKQTRLVTAEQQQAFEQWWEDQGFELTEDVTDRCYDAATELLAAIADYIKLRTMNPAEPPADQVLEQAVSWLTAVQELSEQDSAKVVPSDR